MICKLGVTLGCEGLRKDGHCGVFFKEGVAIRINRGVCEFKNIRASKVGIYAPRRGRMLNPLKAAKAEARNKA